ncbi:porin [Paraburkholderia jirisanensis]
MKSAPFNRKTACAVVLGATGLLAICHEAEASDAVTLYGILDNGFTYTNSAAGHSSIVQQDGNNTGAQGSRFGLRGNEDLGGGLSAIFTLENGYTLPNGGLQQGGLLFGRQAYVGLDSRLGTLTLGRQYDSLSDYLQPLSAAAQWGGYMTGHADEVDNIVDTNRLNNSVKFNTQRYAGFRVGGIYSFGGVPGDVTRNQTFALGADYASGPLVIAAAYLNAKDPNFGFFGGNGNALTPSSVGANGASNTNNIGSTRPAYSGFASAGSEQIAALGTAYAFGKARVGLIYSNVRFHDLGAVAVSGTSAFFAGSSAAFNSIEINFKYQLTPVLLVGAAYNWVNGSSVTTTNGVAIGATYSQFESGIDYFFSKRTDVYFVGVYQHASGTDSTGSVAHASIDGLTPSSTSNQLGLRVALRTRF